MIRIRCPKCQNSFEVDADQAGGVVSCPECEAKLRLPAKKKPVEERITADEPEEERPRRRREEDEQNDEDEPRDDENESPLEERPRKRRRRRRRRRKKRSSGMPDSILGLDIFTVVMIGVTLVGLGLVGLAFAFPPIIVVPHFLGLGLQGVGYVWILVLAFQDDGTQGMLCLCVPCYEIYYVLVNFDDLKTPGIIYVVGIILNISSFVVANIALAQK